LFLGSLEETRAKANKALILSDLSANDEYMRKKVTTKKQFESRKIESPPSLKSSKIYYLHLIFSAF